MSEEISAEKQEAMLEAITATVPPLLHALDALGHIARHVHPPSFASLIDQMGEPDEPLRQAIGPFREAEWPEAMAGFKAQIEKAADEALMAHEEIRSAKDDPQGVFSAYRAFRHQSRALEALYPLTQMLPPVSRFFLDEDARQDEGLLAALADGTQGPHETGLMHARNDKGERGGFSLYVPETYTPDRPHPFIMALHGGSGHGRDFIWSWLRTARSRGAILLSPTSRDSTWSLAGPDVDSESLKRMLTFVRERWNVDESRLLMTGMSDGGTFCYVSGMLADAPFTHLAPMSASFHPMLVSFLEKERIEGLPIFITHGAKDWMFNVEMAQTAARTLEEAGADVTYREIENLSHTYPREVNGEIVDWLMR
ncbi:phospholipase/carboxylesterase [Parvibaculum sp. MBR-TMA-1.3b-4.2]